MRALALRTLPCFEKARIIALPLFRSHTHLSALKNTRFYHQQDPARMPSIPQSYKAAVISEKGAKFEIKDVSHPSPPLRLSLLPLLTCFVYIRSTTRSRKRGTSPSRCAIAIYCFLSHGRDLRTAMDSEPDSLAFVVCRSSPRASATPTQLSSTSSCRPASPVFPVRPKSPFFFLLFSLLPRSSAKYTDYWIPPPRPRDCRTCRRGPRVGEALEGRPDRRFGMARRPLLLLPAL